MAKKRLIVIGGGAAGFFCAVNAARMNPQLSVILLEKSNKLLSKVKISGGGRCNVTHACFDINEMSRRYPRGGNFVKKAFHQFFTTDTLKWFEERGIRIKAESDGRMFPDTDSSQTIIDCLLREAGKYSVDISLNKDVKQLEQSAAGWLIHCNNGEVYNADFVCIACGGYPKSSMFEWITSMGHTIQEPTPSLFTFNMPNNNIRELMGVSVDPVRIKIAGTKLVESGPVLITHWGMSGPAVLRLSAWGARELAAMNYQFTVHINWLEKLEYNEPRLRDALQQFRTAHATKKIVNHNFGELPQRLWQYLLQLSGINTDIRFADLLKKNENMLVKNLFDFAANVSSKTTFKEEFVTAGGIQLSEVDVNTMMSKKASGLFFAGEILDVDGVTGGFNFQHAWTSGFIAAKGILNLKIT